MRTNATSLLLLSDGVIKLDGGCVFGPVPKVEWELKKSPDRRNRITMGLNCLLVRNGDKCILVDTGVGTKESEMTKDRFGLSTSRLARDFRNHGVSPKDITEVILTHLQFDHSGGSTRLDRSGVPVPTFPNATYYVQSTAWEEANNPNERTKDFFHEDDFLPLEERAQLSLLDGDDEVAPGVRVKLTDGPAPGHQIVLVNYGGERVAFMGDLVPTCHHLDLTCIASLDYDPEGTLAKKRALLEEAENGGWLMIFSHGYYQRAGYLERRNGHYNFRAVEL